jgi:polyisoprenoid-binding protein YceI
MPRFLTMNCATLVLPLGFLPFAVAHAQQRPIDTRASVLTVQVSKAGLFSALGHDHEISAPISQGSIDSAAHQVSISVDATRLRVRDQDISNNDRAQIRATMLGPEVLDAQHYSSIVFRATSAQATAPGAWLVRGDLTLHGQSRPIAVDVSEREGHYVGRARFKQTEFGITPVKVAGGAIRVKDELQVEFNIQVAH